MTESKKPANAGVPREKEVRRALSRLVVQGVDAVWSPDAQPLLRLPRVRARIDQLGEDRAATALREVLQEAINDLGPSQYRLLLTIVLGLGPQYKDLSAGEKRALAGRKFRGGHKRVSAGTIRQHHEPRALDELASLLISDEAVGERHFSLDGGQSIVWHPEIHRLIAEERLVFWRLSFFPYDREEVAKNLAKAMRASDIRSWSAYEIYGVFDLLVRAWVPATEPEDRIVRNLEAELRSIEVIQTFIVERVVVDSLWATDAVVIRRPAEHALERLPSAAEIDRINAGDPGLDQYEAEGWIARQPPTAGIGFFVALSQRTHAALPSPKQARLDDWIARISREAGSLSNVSVYAGAGFAHFLIEGTVAPDALHDLNEQLLEQLTPLDHLVSQRVETFLCSAPAPIAAFEEMRGGEPGAEVGDVSRLLQQEEGPHFEVKRSAFSELRRLEPNQDAADLPDSRAVIDALMKTIVAFLNSEGGVVVIGATEAKRLAKSSKLRENEIVDSAPRRGPYLVNGVDHELARGADRYQRRLLDFCRTAIEPDPSAFLRVELEEVDDRTVCVIHVGHPHEWFYFRGKDKNSRFYVRQGASVRELMGPDADRFKTSAKRT